MNSQTLTMFVPLILLIVAMYFLLIRPERKNNGKVPEVNTTEAEQTSGGEDTAQQSSEVPETDQTPQDTAYTGTYQEAMAKAKQIR